MARKHRIRPHGMPNEPRVKGERRERRKTRLTGIVWCLALSFQAFGAVYPQRAHRRLATTAHQNRHRVEEEEEAEVRFHDMVIEVLDAF
jgi:hypothetical protein